MISKGKISREEGWKSLGPWGGKDGDYWDFKVDGPMMQITVRYGLVIDSIFFESKSSDGHVIGSSKKIGGPGGHMTKTFCIESSVEQLSSIDLTYGNYNGQVTIISLCLNTNRTKYGPIGSNWGRFSESIEIEGGVIAGFHGLVGNFITAIGIFVDFKFCIDTSVEQLSSIDLTYGNYCGQVTIISLCFNTNLTKHGPVGSSWGRFSETIRIESGFIAGFHGLVGNFITAIGIFVTPNSTQLEVVAAAARQRRIYLKEWDTETKQYNEVFSKMLNQEEWDRMQCWYNSQVSSEMPQGPSNSDKRKSTEEVAAPIKQLHHWVSSKSNVASFGNMSIEGGITVVNSGGNVSIGNMTMQVDRSEIFEALREILTDAMLRQILTDAKVAALLSSSGNSAPEVAALGSSSGNSAPEEMQKYQLGVSMEESICLNKMGEVVTQGQKLSPEDKESLTRETDEVSHSSEELWEETPSNPRELEQLNFDPMEKLEKTPTNPEN
ncbi:hypothetical protein Vadar_001918 [Vaccinium darrowii]|nr:hypothetical protein Vadar_001918 [Vaccinium darrowii]